MLLPSPILLLFLIPTVAADYLPHTAIPKVPATLGVDAELRCSKIIHRVQYDYAEVADCVPSDDPGNGCAYHWTKDGSPVDLSDPRFKVTNFYSYEYCAVTPKSEVMAAELDLETADDWTKSDSSNTMSCYNSALKISGVRTEDLGLYKCNLTDHSAEPGSNNYGPSSSRVQNITLYDKNDASVSYPKDIEYYGVFAPYDSDRNLVLQCVTSGAPVAWKVRLVQDGTCDTWQNDKSDPCEEKTWFDLSELRKKDIYMCFNHTVRYTSHDTQLYGESLIRLYDISCSETEIVIYCIEDESQYKTANWETSGTTINKYTGNYDDYYRYSWYYREEYLWIPLIIVACVVFVVLIVAIVLTSVRAKCCTNYNQRILYAAAPTSQMVQLPQALPVQTGQMPYAVQAQVIPHAVLQQQAPPHQQRPEAWSRPHEQPQPPTLQVGMPPYQPPPTIDSDFCPS